MTSETLHLKKNKISLIDVFHLRCSSHEVSSHIHNHTIAGPQFSCLFSENHRTFEAASPSLRMVCFQLDIEGLGGLKVEILSDIAKAIFHIIEEMDGNGT